MGTLSRSTVARVPTIYSLAQLDDTDPDCPARAKGVLSTPDKPVSDLHGSLMPAFRFQDLDSFGNKRLRSFGSLDSLTAALGPLAERGDAGTGRLLAPGPTGCSGDESDEGGLLSGQQPRNHHARAASPSPLESSEGDSDEWAAPRQSVLTTLLLAEWEDRAERGLFRYDVTACPTRVLPGRLGFVAQLNEGRASKKRPTEFRVDVVTQDYDPTKFNFTKAAQKEVLFAFEALRARDRRRPPRPGASPGGRGEEGAALEDEKSSNPSPHHAVTSSHQHRQHGGARGPTRSGRFVAATAPGDSPNLVFINVSPIEYGHVLLVPDVLGRLPQAVTQRSALLALQFAREAGTPYLRLGFNSLGAYGTVNHLHFQAYMLMAPFAVERALTTVVDVPWQASAAVRRRGSSSVPGGGGAVDPATLLLPPPTFGDRTSAADEPSSAPFGSSDPGPSITVLGDYPVRGVVFVAGDSLADLAAVVAATCVDLAAVGVPHNLLFSDSGARVVDMQVDPACWEISGHMVMKRAEDYGAVDEDLAWRLLSYASFDEARFADVLDMCIRSSTRVLEARRLAAAWS